MMMNGEACTRSMFILFYVTMLITHLGFINILFLLQKLRIVTQDE